MSEKKPKRCQRCRSTNIDGPWGVVFFCNGCGLSIDATGAAWRPKPALIAPSSWSSPGEISTRVLTRVK